MSCFCLWMGAALLGPHLSAQEELARWSGELFGDRFGAALAEVPDLDEDGVAEIAVGATQVGRGRGLVRVHSLGSSSELLRVSGAATNDAFGGAIAAVSDVTGDGLADLIVGSSGDDRGAGGGGSAIALASMNGDVQWTLFGDSSSDQLGIALATAPDVDGDGSLDVYVGIPREDSGAPNGGAVALISGADGMLIWLASGGSTGGLFGSSLAVLNDVDGDGVADVIAGAPGASDTLASEGVVRVLSGATGAELVRVTSGVIRGRFGAAVGAVGDLNGDGVADFLSGSPETDQVRLHSGADGSQIADFAGASGSAFGASLAGGVDFDGDGVVDFAIGAPAASNGVGAVSGTVTIFSGASLSESVVVHGETAGESFGSAVLLLADVDGGRRAGLLVGSPFRDEGLPDVGQVVLFGGAVAPEPEPDPEPPAGLALAAEAAGKGRRVRLSLEGGEPGDCSVVLLVAIDGIAIRRVAAMGRLDDAGELHRRRCLPPSLRGAVLSFQAFAGRPPFDEILSSEVVDYVVPEFESRKRGRRRFRRP